jgi:hypothetical protein
MPNPDDANLSQRRRGENANGFRLKAGTTNIPIIEVL